MPRGSRPGENRGGGRKPGTKNRATIERELIAAKTIDAAREGKIELAKDVLERMMKLAEGATGVNQPTTERDIASGKQKNPDGDWSRFGEWFDRTAYCAKELAKYQSPTFRAVEISTAGAPQEPKDMGNVIELTDQTSIARVYQRIVKASGGRP